MSRRRLSSTVYVQDKDGRSRGFGPGDTVPAWAAKLITNPSAWADDEPADDDAVPEPSVLEQLADRARSLGTPDEDVEALANLDDGDVELLAALSDEDLAELIAAGAAPAEPGAPASVPVELPPRGGPGSGIDVWRAFAVEHDITVPEDASREDVIAAVEAAVGQQGE